MSHFTKIKTKLYNLEILKQTLSDLNLNWNVSPNIMFDTENQTNKDDVILLNEHSKSNVSFKWNGLEYELVTDLMYWSESYSVEKFLSRLHQRYAYNLIILTSEKEGFQFNKSEVLNEGSIRLVLRRYV
jgi:hypothetical protein